MTDSGDFDVEEVGSQQSGEDPARSQPAWISGLQWGPPEGLKTAKGAGLVEEVGRSARTLAGPPQTLIV